MTSCVGAATYMSFKAGDITPALVGIGGTFLSCGLYVVEKKKNYPFLNITSNGIIGGAIVLNELGPPLITSAASIGIISAVAWCAFDPIIKLNVAKYQIPISLALMGSIIGLTFYPPLYVIPSVMGFAYIATIDIEQHRELIDAKNSASIDVEDVAPTEILSNEKNVSLSILDNMCMIFMCISLTF